MPAPITDKHHTIEGLCSERPVMVELGCGGRKRNPNAVGIDILDSECVDIVGDVFDVLTRFPDRTVSEIASFHFLEHVAAFEALVDELARVLIDDGLLKAVVPHFSNPYFYSDPTHRHPFGLYSFSYFAQDDLLSRKVPHYGNTPVFRLCAIDLGFKAARPFYVRYAIKRLMGFVFNSCYYAKEFYEENLSHVLPCYEVRFTLRRLARQV